MKRVKAKPGKRFVLASFWKPGRISKMQPSRHSKDPRLAMKFTAKFLNSTCWDWQLFYNAVPVTEHDIEIRRRNRRRLKLRTGSGQIKRRATPRPFSTSPA